MAAKVRAAETLLDHLRLQGVAGGAEGDMVNRAGPLTAAQEIPCLAQIDDAADRCVGRLVANHQAFAGDLGETEDVGQDRPGEGGHGHQQARAMEAADRVLDRDLAAAPRGLVRAARHGDERQPHAVGVLERENGVAEALHRRLVGNPFSINRCVQ